MFSAPVSGLGPDLPAGKRPGDMRVQHAGHTIGIDHRVAGQPVTSILAEKVCTEPGQALESRIHIG